MLKVNEQARLGDAGDPFIRSLTDEERQSFLCWRGRYGAKTARRLVRRRRESPAGPPRRQDGRASLGLENEIIIGDWLVVAAGRDEVRIVLLGVTHELTARQARLIKAALTAIAP